MENLVFSPISTDELIDRIAIKAADLIIERQNAAIEPAEELLSPKQACEFFQCTSVTLWRWEKKGRVKSYGIGGKKFFKRSELLQLIVEK